MICGFFYYAVLIIIAIYAVLCVYLWLWNVKTCRPCHSNESLKGKTVIVTGASAGIGKAAAMDFAMRGARLILACRNLEKAKRVADHIIVCSGNEDVHVRHLDTSILSSVRKFAKETIEKEKKLDVLALNAGMSGRNNWNRSEDGFELTIATNHFGHFLLANLLCGLMKKTPQSRIVITASSAHMMISDLDTEDLNIQKHKYNFHIAYCNSKLCNVYMTRHLAQLLKGTGVTVNCFCPRAVATELIDTSDVLAMTIVGFLFPWPLARTIEQGAQTLIHLAVAKEVEGVTGKFFRDLKVETPTPLSEDKHKIQRVWELSEKFVGLKEEEKTI